LTPRMGKLQYKMRSRFNREPGASLVATSPVDRVKETELTPAGPVTVGPAETPPMRCEKCPKPATFHITDIVEKGKHQEFHFCDEHARQHLAPTDETSEQPISELAKKLIVSGQGPQREPSPADKQVCPICQITFLEFRNSGRLGCPYDYEVFRDELMPLLENIHGETRHSGKVPRRAPRNTQQQTTLIQLRNELKRAVAAEDYESAARLRDQIKGIELEQGR
jgi:protein arginine kinase activator